MVFHKIRLVLMLTTLYLCCHVELLQAKTRFEAVSSADSYQTIPSWTPTKDNYNWPNSGPVFQSFYTIANASHTEYPYVYGGKDSPARFIQRVHDEGAVPGGHNMADPDLTTSALYRYNNYSLLPRPPAVLAGIDCSGFATLVLFGAPSLTLNTRGLADISVLKDEDAILPGDLLIIPDDHVKVVVSTTPLTVVEAAQGIGKVGRGETAIGGYGVYSTFPVFGDTVPGNGGVAVGARPTISAVIKSTANITLQSVSMRIDGGEAFSFQKKQISSHNPLR